MIVAVSIWAAYVMAHGGPLPKPPQPAPFPAFPLTHLWFLYVLLWLYAATLSIRGIVTRLDPRGRLTGAADTVVRLIIRTPFGFSALALPTAATFVLVPVWAQWFGILTPDMSLLPNIEAVVGFGTAFGFGWLLHRQRDLLAVLQQRWLLHLGAALACTVAALSIAGVTPLLVPAPHNATTVLYAAIYALGIWSWAFALIGGCLRFLSSHSRTWRYVADSSYWLYLMHLPLVMALQVVAAQFAAPWWVKFPLVLAVALPVLLLTYHLFVRYSFIGAILNGRRESRSHAPVAVLKPEPAE